MNSIAVVMRAWLKPRRPCPSQQRTNANFVCAAVGAGVQVVIVINGESKAHALQKCIEEGMNHMWTVSMVQVSAARLTEQSSNGKWCWHACGLVLFLWPTNRPTDHPTNQLPLGASPSLHRV